MVDDEKDILDQAERFLGDKFGLNLDTSSSVKEALELLESNSYDCVVSDYKMPDLNGLDFLKIIREEWGNDLSFILFTHTGNEDVAMKALNLGADRYLRKGYDPKSLYEKLKEEISEVTAKGFNSDRIYSDFIEKSDYGFLVIDPENGEFLEINDSYREMLGYSNNELLSMSIFDVDVDVDGSVGSFNSRIKEILENGDARFETKLKTKSGDIIDVEVSANLLQKNEKVVYAFVRDLTERKRVEERLKRSQSISNVGSWEIELETGSLEWSDETYRIFGIPRGTPINYEKFLNYLHPEDRDFADNEWKNALETGDYNIEHRILVDGKTKWVKQIADIEFDEQGNPIEAIGTVQDITERKKIEEDLREYKIAIQEDSSPITAIDDEYKYLFANKSYKKYHNITEDSIRGKRIDEALNVNKFMSEIKPKLDKCLSGERVQYETKRTHPELGERILKASYYPLRKDSEINGIVGVFNDITERRQHEEKEDFLHSLLRHDLRNKIQLIQGYQQLLEDLELPKEAEKYVSKSLKTSQVSQDIINKVSTLRQAQEETSKEVRIDKIVHESIEQTEGILEQNNFELELNCPDECTVRGGDLLTQVFSNIIENAAQHSEGNKISISGEITDDSVICTIEDDGRGIPEEKQEEIFEKGYTTDEERGTGLGLFLVKTLLEIYNGTIKVQGKESGGTIFKIELERF